MVILVRGINLGPRNRLPMPEFRELLAELGYGDPETLIASGNAVVDTTDRPAAVEKAVRAGLAERFGLDVAVLARSTRQIAAVVKADPFGDRVEDPRHYHVAFLSAKPKAAALEKLPEPGCWELHGKELYLWLPRGVQDSKLFRSVSDKTLGVVATVRTWRTVTKLHEMAAARR